MDLATWASFSGRIGRHQYWFHYVIPIYFAQFVVGVFAGLFGDVFALPGILLLWPALAGLSKRLHDLNLSLRYMVACFGGVMVGGVLAAVLIPSGVPAAGIAGVVIAALSALAGAVMSFMAYFIRGTWGPNNFGPDPLADPSAIEA